MQTDLAHQCVRVERGGGVGFEERDEGAALLRQDANVLDRSEAYLGQELVDRSVGGQVSDVNSPSLLRQGEQEDVSRALPFALK